MEQDIQILLTQNKWLIAAIQNLIVGFRHPGIYDMNSAIENAEMVLKKSSIIQNELEEKYKKS